MLKMLAGQYRHAEAQFREIEATLMVLHRGNELSQRLASHSVSWTGRCHGDGCEDR